jgi:hypothetical protein
MAGEGKSAVRASYDARWVEEVEFRLIFVAAFIVFLTATAVSHLMPWRWGSGPRADGNASIIERAREASSTITGLAFMG